MRDGFNKISSSSLFLTELIISLFFFAITCAVCVQIFARAYLVTKRASDETKAGLFADSIAQIYISCGGDLSRIYDEFPNYCIMSKDDSQSTGSIIICLDKDFNPIMSPASDINETANNTYYETVITTKLVYADDLYKDYSDNSRLGYASDACIYVFNTSHTHELITGEDAKDAASPILQIPMGLYLGLKKEAAYE
ncbi:hypothetical protein [Butyrivibrio sp. MC2013]|uniref:hypothetical protein n=1 Tax=Butyrivibrio sp. MC2013 TaxID=1280686 RepID=UPI00042964BD|nr:hypothetical protein [Butyrivibrio sp. MC2013]